MDFVRRFLNKGTEEISDQYDSRRMRLLNLFYIVATATLLASFIQSIIAGEPTVMSVVLIAACVLMTGVPVLGRRNPDYGAVYIIFLSNALVWFFANSQGLASGTYFYYFPLFFANGWLMDFRKPWSTFLLPGMTLAGVIMVMVIPESVFGLSVSEEIQKASFIFNLSAAAFIMGVNTIVIVWMNYKRQLELETQITEREQASAELSTALKEKEVLLAEIHHRVKNNLAVVRGLLNMQLNTTSNEVAKATLRESVNRVSAMALIHQKLYSKKNPESIDLCAYVNELVREIAATYHSNENGTPQVNTDVRDITLTLNRAVPCGLILNELLSNAFKHAFRNEKKGIIDITITYDPAKNGYLNLVVADNGNGMPEGFRPEKSPTLGMTIIQSLSEQLDGEFTYGSSHSGTQMKVNFPASGV